MSAIAGASRLPATTSVRPAFVASVRAFLQTARPLAPAHIHPDFVFRGSIPESEMRSREAYFSYREKGVLTSFADWINNPTEVIFSATTGPNGEIVREGAVAKLCWSGTHTADGGVLGQDKKATGRRVSYRGIVWLSRDEAVAGGVEGLTFGEVYGDLARFKRQLEGTEVVSDEEWARVRTPVDGVL